MNLLITGTSRGIGLEMVRVSVERGWRVFACCRHPQQAEALLGLATLAPGKVSVHIADMRELATLQSLAYELRNESIDMLINNAGVYGPDQNQFGEVDVAGWEDAFLVNCIAPLKLAELMLGQLQGGRQKIIACLSSKMASMADNGSGGSYIYRSSKAALNAVVKSMSVDLAARDIKAVALHPGWVKTDMGGPNAEISVRESVNRLFEILLALEASDSGRFIDIDGKDIPW
jgi:NAD(P)-dependent dehydrogenase (short-subunit alcohol dehydrogenase family)